MKLETSKGENVQVNLFVCWFTSSQVDFLSAVCKRIKTCWFCSVFISKDFTCSSVEVTGFILQYYWCVASVSVWVAMQKKVCAEGFALQDYIMMWFTFYLFKCIPSKRLHALCIPWLSRNSHEWIQAAQVWIRLQYWLGLNVARVDWSIHEL